MTLLFLLSTGKVMNEVLAASSVPGLVEISETDVLQSSNERHTGSIKRSPAIACWEGSVLSGAVSNWMQRSHACLPSITCRSRFNFINSRHKLYEFLVHSCSFWGSTQTNSITSVRDTHSHCPQLVEESLATNSISSIALCMMGRTEGEETLPQRLTQMARPIVLLHQRFFFLFFFSRTQ